MAALNFPTSPSIGQTYSANNFEYTWDGTSWTSSSTVSSISTIEDIQDVTLTSVSDGQLLQYEASSGYWINTTFSGSPLVESPVGTFTLSGDLTVNGTITETSDERLKENIDIITSPLDIVKSLDGVYYNFKSDESKSRHVGLIAQNVQEVLPEAVVDNGEVLSVAYGNIVGLLIEAIKDLESQIQELKK